MGKRISAISNAEGTEAFQPIVTYRVDLLLTVDSELLQRQEYVRRPAVPCNIPNHNPCVQDAITKSS